MSEFLGGMDEWPGGASVVRRPGAALAPRVAVVYLLTLVLVPTAFMLSPRLLDLCKFCRPSPIMKYYYQYLNHFELVLK